MAQTSQPCEADFDGVRDCLRRIDEHLPEVSALVVHNESALAPLLSILRSAGRRIPEDVSIVAVCPRDVALALPVRLTSIDIPAHEVGTVAVEMLMNLLAGPHAGQTRLLAPVLVERDSCAAAD